METLNFSFYDLLLLYILLLIPWLISYYLKLGIIRDSIVSIARMTLQLLLVGLYLSIIFKLNSFWLNLAWVTAMLITANITTLRRSNLAMRFTFLVTFAATAVGFTSILIFFVAVVIRPVPVFDARYIIPIAGMLLGNCLRGNVIALERFYSGINEHEKEYVTYVLLGANVAEATRPYLRLAIRAAISPHIATMATLGIVALPGMMTGQILGGAMPNVAIKYQIAIMICIFCSMLISSVLNIYFTRRYAFDDYGMLRREIFHKSN
ncbi:ABC transporter permease [Lentisphaerota bacterium ZTH]|nr:ABC transporter permease [Lentisphaerota bacterium]WET06387.1 ABC transporter permease [Lentisphaerota bacterium ZTH]